MAEVRVDALTGLRVLLDEGTAAVARDAREDLFHAEPGPLAREDLPLASLDVWRERVRVHDGAAYVHVWSSETRAELVALPFVPAAIARERERFGAYATRTMGQNLLEDLVQEEVRRRERLVTVDSEAVCWAPFASQVPYQLVIAPRTPRARWEDDGPLGAALLEDMLGRLARLDRTEYDLWVRTAPRGAESFCWRIDVLPRAPATGLALGTGVGVCAVAPERAARELRDA